jgi:glutaminase
MDRILDTFARYTGHELDIDDAVYESESATGHRNRAIAHLLYGHEILDRSPEEVVDLYFRQCSILVTARDLAMMASCLANNGVNPVTGVVALKSHYVEKVLSVMSTCGMYDYSGAWIFDVGMPAKSGVGGGIMAVLPGQFGLGVFSPLLDPKGNSVRGIEACKRLSTDFSLHMFNVARSTSTSVVRKTYNGAKFGSRRQRNEAELRALKTRAQRVRIYELQGELLFGNTESVVLGILSDLSEFDYLIISLRRAINLDRSAIQLFTELCLRVNEADKVVFFTDCQHLYRLRKKLQAIDVGTQDPGWLSFADSDHAQEWCEDRLLVDLITGSREQVADLSAQHLCKGMTDETLERLRSLGQQRRFASGECIVKTGEPAESMFFINAGELEVVVDADAQKRLRLKTLGPGTVFGEMALIQGKTRSADVMAASDVDCLEVRFEDLDEGLRTQILTNMASYFANKIQQDTSLMQHLA